MSFQDGFQFYIGQFAAGLIVSLPIFAVIIGAVTIEALLKAKRRERERKEREQV